MATKHEKSFVNYDRTYESNVIGLRGVVYFAVGLFLLIVITFGLMYFLLNVMADQSAAEKGAKSPMAMSPQENLPPEPRLQAAPGYGVDTVNGRVNLELKAPQSEYRELRDQWEKQWKNGQKDLKTGTVMSLPIEDAKNKLLQENVKARNGEDGKNALDEARTFVSYSSAGRVSSDKRR